MMDLLCHNGCRSFREAENHTAIDLAILAGRALLHRHDWVANAADRILHVHSLLTSIAPPPAASAQLISTALGLGNRDAVTLYQANCASFLAALRVARSIIPGAIGVTRDSDSRFGPAVFRQPTRHGSLGDD
ncbi:MAG: hypothetical protein M5U09_09975 [Gammaproteobacteria bacterium]|nr:hypothetical protein [Gammaproteobacteria bacterium]